MLALFFFFQIKKRLNAVSYLAFDFFGIVFSALEESSVSCDSCSQVSESDESKIQK